MPLHLSLAVGLGSSFQYQLRIGTPKTAEPTATKAKAHSSTRSQQLACVLFTKIPPEIRRMIYRHLLVSGESILLPRKRASHETVVNPRNGSWRVSGYGIDVTLMQTCQIIYGETVSILYGDNEFQFTYPKDIGNFQNHGLKRVSENCYPGMLSPKLYMLQLMGADKCRIPIQRHALWQVEITPHNTPKFETSSPFSAICVFVCGRTTRFINTTRGERLLLEMVVATRIRYLNVQSCHLSRFSRP